MGENPLQRTQAMGNLIRSLSSFIGGRPDVMPHERHSEASMSHDNGAADSTPATSDVVAKSEPSHDAPREVVQPALPLVTYTVPSEETASSRLRRSRSVSLLRQSTTLAMTSRAVPTMPSIATRHPQVHPVNPVRPVLTETERVRLQIMQAQIQLSSLHLYEGPIDGIMTPATATAVRYFQTLKGLRASGTLAAGTLAALGVPLIA